MLARVLVGVGSSIAPREEFIDCAIQLINEKVGTVIKKSKLLYNPPAGPNAQNEFANGAILVETHETPQNTLKLLRSIEEELGRERLKRWGDRTIDLDIIMWQSQGKFLVLDEHDLVIPHPRAYQREFVLKPCREIAPAWMDFLSPGPLEPSKPELPVAGNL